MSGNGAWLVQRICYALGVEGWRARPAPCGARHTSSSSPIVSPRLTSVLLTVVGFTIGYGAARSVQTVPSVPAPPSIALLDDGQKGGVENPRPIDRAKLIAEIDALRPQITAYCLRVEEIESEFRLEFVKLLTPPQVQKYEANQRKFA